MQTDCSKKTCYTAIMMGGRCQRGLGQTKIQNWRKMAMDREEWKRIVEQAKTHKVLKRLYKKNVREITIRKEREKE